MAAAARLGAALIVTGVAGSALAAAQRQPTPPLAPAGPLADLAVEIDFGQWRDGYPAQTLAALRAARPEQFVLPAPGYVAPAAHQLALPQIPLGVPTQIYDAEGVKISLTVTVPPESPTAYMVDYVIEADGKPAAQGRHVAMRGAGGAPSQGYQKVPTAADPGQVIALQFFNPSTLRGVAGAVLPGMGAYQLSASQNVRGRREGDDPAGSATCSNHVPMPSEDYVSVRKARGEIVVRAKADGGYEALGGMNLPPLIAGLPGPAKPPGGWCDQPPG